jgi:hypothetical protein
MLFTASKGALLDLFNAVVQEKAKSPKKVQKC